MFTSIHLGPNSPIGGVGSGVGVKLGRLLLWSSPLTIVSTCPTRSMFLSFSLFRATRASMVVWNFVAIEDRLSPGCTVYCTGLPGWEPWAEVTGWGVVVGWAAA